jgi:hypothetical protein
MWLHFRSGLKNHKAAHAPSTQGNRADHGASRGHDAICLVIHRRLFHGQPFLKINCLERQRRKRREPTVVYPRAASRAVHEQKDAGPATVRRPYPRSATWARIHLAGLWS